MAAGETQSQGVGSDVDNLIDSSFFDEPNLQ